MLINILINILIILLIILFFIILINQIFLENNLVEGYMAVIGPFIYEKEKKTNTPINTYYTNNIVKQDFDPYSVIQDYNPNSIFIQEDYDSDCVITTDS